MTRNERRNDEVTTEILSGVMPLSLSEERDNELPEEIQAMQANKQKRAAKGSFLHIVTAIMLLTSMLTILYFMRSTKRFRLPSLMSFRCVFMHVFTIVFVHMKAPPFRCFFLNVAHYRSIYARHF